MPLASDILDAGLLVGAISVAVLLLSGVVGLIRWMSAGEDRDEPEEPSHFSRE